MNAPGFLITGSGRSGTAYIAEVLGQCGLNVGHEGWWTLDNHVPVEDLDGDASWLGCFDLGFTGKVYAQVRNPLQAIPSIHYRENIYPFYLIRRLTVELTGDWAVDAALIWLRYNRMALKRAVAWWRVEDVSAVQLAGLFGIEQRQVAKALRSTPTDVNKGGDDVPYDWPDHPVIDEVRCLAEELGYRR
jgi:hypothetical protein